VAVGAVWVARPNLGDEIATEADEEFRQIILEYVAEGVAPGNQGRKDLQDLDQVSK